MTTMLRLDGRRRLRLGAAAAVGVVWILATASVAAKPLRQSLVCSSADSITVAQNSLVRVFLKRRSGRYYICSIKTGDRHFIGPGPHDDLDNERLGRFRLNGSLLAYARSFAEFRADPEYSIYVRDVRTGHLIRRVVAAPRESGRRDATPQDGVRDLVVTRRGAVAWIIVNPYAAPGSAIRQVRKSDGAGDGLLDGGDGIEDSSLTLFGSTVSWRSGNQRKRATLE